MSQGTLEAEIDMLRCADRVHASVARVREQRLAKMLDALDSILRECDEAPTDNNEWVVAIQKIAREALSPVTNGDR